MKIERVTSIFPGLRNRLSGARSAINLTCSSYDELRVQSAVLFYVVGEGHYGRTIAELAGDLLEAGEIRHEAVEGAVGALVGQGLLEVVRDVVFPGRAAPILTSSSA